MSFKANSWIGGDKTKPVTREHLHSTVCINSRVVGVDVAVKVSVFVSEGLIRALACGSRLNTRHGVLLFVLSCCCCFFRCYINHDNSLKCHANSTWNRWSGLGRSPLQLQHSPVESVHLCPVCVCVRSDTRETRPYD